MKRRDFVIRAATVVGTLPIVRTAFGQTPCPPGTLSIEGGTSSGDVACGESPTSSLIQVSETPEQIAVYSDASSFDASAYATLEYKLTSASTWRQGHPLYRVRPGTADDAFAGCIFDLQPGQLYDVRVTFTDGSGSVQEQAQFSTRRLPADVSSQSATTTVSSLSDFETAINNANPGDVIELSDGTYSLSSTISINGISGTAANPIYIRGESKAGTIINRSSAGRVFSIAGNSYCEHLVFENMTMDAGYAPEAGSNGGSGTDSIKIGQVAPLIEPEYISFRNLVISGSPMGIKPSGGTGGNLINNILVYNCTMTGTKSWIDANIASSGSDGVRLAGKGNCVWNNTMEGYGDSIAFAHSNDEAVGTLECNYAYRNYLRNSHDNVIELDHAQRLHAFYDNYCENLNTGPSQSDNATTNHYGPSYVFRNIFVNIARRLLKANSGGIGGEPAWQGWHWYNNTCVRAKGDPGSVSENTGYAQSGGTRNNRFAFRNNIFISRETSGKLWNQRLTDGRDSPHYFDTTHNAWYQTDREIEWQNSARVGFANVNDAIAGSPIAFGSDSHNVLYPAGSGLVASTRFHEHDAVSEYNPFTNTLTLGADTLTEVTGMTTLEIDAASNLKNAGTPIPGITDGYSGAAPDIGAIIEGRGAPNWGAQ